MAKVQTPDTPLTSFQTLGRSITLRSRKEGYTVSKTSRPSLVSEESLELVQETSEAKFTQWLELTDEQRQDWEALGVLSYQTGFSAFMLEAFKEQLQSLYGYARYGQNVSMKV